MPILKSSKKALKQSKRNREQNDQRKKVFRKALKDFRQKPSQKLLNAAFSSLDRAVDNNTMHKNRANRLKKNLAKLLTK